MKKEIFTLRSEYLFFNFITNNESKNFNIRKALEYLLRSMIRRVIISGKRLFRRNYRRIGYMRIISGEYKGRRLATPADYSIRPTSDKVKEALFSMLTDRIWDSRVLDLFSGTGNIGIEALSRGAAECVFADNSRESIRLIKENIVHCKAEEGAIVAPGDYKKVLMNQNKPFDIIILDPPYDKGYLDDCFKIIEEEKLLKEDGVIIAEHRKEEKLPDDFHGFTKKKERKYGIVMLSIYG